MLRKFNWVLVVGMIIGTLYFVIFQYDSSRILTYLAVIPVVGFPLLVSRTKFRMREKELCYYYLFIFLADFLGCVVNLYNIVWWYDSFVHFVSGIFTFGVGIFLLDKISVVKKDYLFYLLFCLCLVMFVASMWELFEFGVDNLLGMNLQHSVDTGVVDTMIDMLSAFIGGILGSCYFVYRKQLVK